MNAPVRPCARPGKPFHNVKREQTRFHPSPVASRRDGLLVKKKKKKTHKKEEKSINLYRTRKDNVRARPFNNVRNVLYMAEPIYNTI